MNRYPSQQVVYAPPGPSALILPGVILAPLGLVGLAAGLEVMKRDFFIGVVCCVPGALVFAFLAFCLALHIRAQRLWDWHVRTGRIPYFRKHGFLKGALLGGELGVVAVVAAAVLGFKYADHPQFGEIATAAFYLAWLWGVLLIGVLAVVFGWFKRAWDRTALPDA
ncbi:TPA: hypothetical protein ACGCF2_000353 [Stenotrophomonas maltophilia]